LIDAIVYSKNGVTKIITNDETNVGSLKWSDVVFAYIFDLYEKEWRHFDKSCLSFKHWTHIWTKHHY
jgi:hypothetical protein